ncbi:hypothetical protein IQ269_02295 [Tychonema sp. LEGE 07199]|uniref:hypothetical protein n=2 Tax=Tychonema TaxID=54312 RepID=UPI00187F4960|nr:hypothetical protein [Tychonema sp. LEGE 07199]MBE9119661.1 hypothetical protein [Tychonema sp. LEGE 07199]MBE9132210.1 hypothetical protein [Tychonema sp. LEGE 07196]
MPSTWQGNYLSIYTHCKTGMLPMLFPLIVPLLMQPQWSLNRKITCFVAYLGAIIIITTPWNYHNYRTHKTSLPQRFYGAAVARKSRVLSFSLRTTAKTQYCSDLAGRTQSGSEWRTQCFYD